MFGAVTWLVSTGLSVDAARQFMVDSLTSEGMVSNLGVLPFETCFGALKLDAMWGPAILTGVDGEQVLGAVTVDGAMCLLHTSYDPIPSFLLEIEKVLSAACDTRTEPE